MLAVLPDPRTAEIFKPSLCVCVCVCVSTFYLRREFGIILHSPRMLFCKDENLVARVTQCNVVGWNEPLRVFCDG
jgi:hypothetical protein